MKQIVKPKLYSAQDVYMFYVKKKLKENDNYYIGRDKITISNTKHNLVLYCQKERGKVEVVMTYKIFKNILSEINKMIGEYLIKGEIVNLGYNLGSLGIRKIQRNFKKKSIDWNETKKEKKKLLDQGIDPSFTGEQYIVYHSEPSYYRIGWIKNKSKCKIENMTQYRFDPASGKGENGFKNKFKSAIKERPYLGNNYQEFKYKPYVKVNKHKEHNSEDNT